MATSEPSPSSPVRVMVRFEVVVGIVITGLAAALCIWMPALIASGGIESAQDFTTLTPVFFPRLALGVLALLGLVYVIQTVWNLQHSTPGHSVEETGRIMRAGLMAVVTVVYAIVVPWLGFTISTMVMTAFVGVFLGLRHPLALVPGTVVIPIVIRFVFERLLLISLPRGSIESFARVEDALMTYLANLILGS